MSSVLFYDPACPAPYDARTLHEGSMGGSEASVVRIAEALDAVVIQHNRTEAEGRYRPPGRIEAIEHVVVVRYPDAVEGLLEQYPRAQIALWLHDRFRARSKRGRDLVASAARWGRRSVTLVCNSDFQRRGVDAAVGRMRGPARVRTRRIYNPIDDDLTPDGSPVDRSRLVFFSSPNKGLAFTLDVFRALRRRMPDLRLRIGNPGYRKLGEPPIPGVEWLGSLPHGRVIEELRGALCVLYPNFVFQETFGLVFAEANAVGTPVLTHPWGSASEVLDDPRQLLPVPQTGRLYERLVHGLSFSRRRLPARLADGLGMFDRYVEQVEAWREGERPDTGPDPRFRLGEVAGQWRAMFREGGADGGPGGVRGGVAGAG